MIVALLPAGGQSRRMGRPKLLLPLGSQTILERVVQTIRQAGIEQILVVATGQVPDLAEAAKRAGAAVVTLADETSDMRATVTIGLEWIEHNWSPAADDTWLLVPADHPTLEASIVGNLKHAMENDPQHSIFVPAYQGRRGHPTLIRWRHVEALQAFPTGQGLNSYFRSQANEVLEVPVDSAEILRDLDTPEDYEQLLRELSKD